MIKRNDPCFCGSGKKWKQCHYPQEGVSKIILKTKEQIVGIRKACALAVFILDALCEAACEGVTTNELNCLAERLHRDAGAIAAPLHYGNPPYPKSICTSLNEVICHGIPDDRPLKDGDILNIDVSPIVGGFYGDCSKMVIIGETTEERRRVVEAAYHCLMDTIVLLKPGLPISFIGDSIERIAASYHCSVVYQFVGHGVGVDFHEEPQIPHAYNTISQPLLPGMTFTIEPMINTGKREAIIDPIDLWTARTVDGKPSAQFEHTLYVTNDGVEILTPWKVADFLIKS